MWAKVGIVPGCRIFVAAATMVAFRGEARPVVSQNTVQTIGKLRAFDGAATVDHQSNRGGAESRLVARYLDYKAARDAHSFAHRSQFISPEMVLLCEQRRFSTDLPSGEPEPPSTNSLRQA